MEKGLIHIYCGDGKGKTTAAVGLCVRACGDVYKRQLYNVAAVFCQGKLLGLTAKSHIPNYSEFYEARHFAPAPPTPVPVTFCGQETVLGCELVYTCMETPEFTVGVEICEDLWVPEPPCAHMAQAGATLLLKMCIRDRAASLSITFLFFLGG